MAKGDTWGWIDPWGSVTEPPPPGWEGEVAPGPAVPDVLARTRDLIVKRGVVELVDLWRRGSSNEEIADKQAQIGQDLLGLFYMGINDPRFGGQDITGGAPDPMNRLQSLVWAELGQWGENARQGIQKAGEAAYPGWDVVSRGAGGQYPWLAGAVEPTPDWAAIYERARPKAGAPSLVQYFKEQFTPIQREYRASILPKPLSINLPEQPTAGGFESFLGQYPWLQKYMEIPPRQRGEYPSRFQPPTRWLTY